MSLLANYPFFFDSPEYVALSRVLIRDALYLAHPLAHPVSIALWRVSYLVFGPHVWTLSLVSLIFWLIAVVAMVNCVPKDRRIMISAICLLLPLPWLVMTNVLVDAVSTSLFTLGVVCIWKQRQWSRVLLATVLFGLSIFNYLGMAVWLVIPAIVICFDNQLAIKTKVAMVATISTGVGFAIGGLMTLGLLTTKVGIGLSSVPVAIYHGAIAFTANYTSISVVLTCWFGLLWIKRREWDKLAIMFVVLVVYVISITPWHSGPYGRLGVFLVFPLAYLYAMLPRWTLVVVILWILPGWFEIARAYQSTPLPVLQQELVESADCKDYQLIFSEIQRPQISLIYPKAWYVGSTNWQEIIGKMKSVEHVCVSQQAIDYPYKQFEGQLPFSLSGKEGSKGLLKQSLENVITTVIKEDLTHPELTIYKISR